MSGRIGIGIWLEINNELFSPVVFVGPFHPLLYLLFNGGQLPRQLRSKRIHIAIGTPTITFRAIPVRTSEAPVGNDFINPLTIILIFQISAVMIIILMPVI